MPRGVRVRMHLRPWGCGVSAGGRAERASVMDVLGARCPLGNRTEI